MKEYYSKLCYIKLYILSYINIYSVKKLLLYFRCYNGVIVVIF